MSSTSTKDQVFLNELVFTQSWEDPASDIKALGDIRGKKIMTITSGACNSIGFLRYDPEIIFAVDINPTQTYILELKMAAMKALEYDAFTAFLGLQLSRSRLETFDLLRPNLTDDAQAYWDQMRDAISEGFLGKGRFEKYTRKTARLMRMLQGKRRVQGLFNKKTIAEQQQYFDKRWNTWRLRSSFKILYSKRRLAKRGLKSDYFQFDDGSKSFAENFYNRHRNVMRNIPIRGNYFVSLYLLGEYRAGNEVPDYLNPEYFETIKARLDRIRFITSDAKEWLLGVEPSSIDGFSLSNICELMSEADTLRTFQGVLHAGKNGAKICFRNLMVPRAVPESHQKQIVKDVEASRGLLKQDRSFVYSKVDVMEIQK